MVETGDAELLSHDKLSEIAKALEEDIIFGRLAPGTRLIEDVLMARFDVTRHFIRQVLYRLERMGVVTREKNKGAMVRSLNPKQVRQIYDVREMLQREAALKIPLPAPRALLDELERIHADYCRAIENGHMRSVHELNDRFHITLFSACGNPYLVDLIKYYMWLTLPIRAKNLADSEKLMVSRQHHALMIDMLRGRDNWVLAQLCVDHVQPSKREYLDKVDDPQGS